MAVLTVIPTKDVKLNDVRDTLNANGGNVSDDLTTFFTDGTQSRQRYSGVPPVLVAYYPNAKINRWAKYKPYRHVKPAGDLGITAIRSLNFGLSATSFTVTESGGDVVFTGFAKWAYSMPDGSDIYPMRLEDFRGYNPAAIPAIKPPAEISWNVADGGDCPNIVIPYRYNGTINASATDAMECEVSGVVGGNAYLCVMAKGGNNPYLFVANAAEAMSLKGGGTTTQASVIELRKFSILNGILGNPDIVVQAENSYAYGAKYTLHVGINIISNRVLNKVFHLNTLDLSTLGTYGSSGADDINYNGVTNEATGVSTFKNMPLGETTIDFYRYSLLSWMYGIVGGITLRSYNHTDYYADILQISTGVNAIHEAYYNYLQASYSKYCDVEFTIRIANNGASLSIGGRVFTKGKGGAVTITLSDMGANSLVFYINNHESASPLWLPKLRAYKNGSSYVYTQFEADEMGLDFGYSADTWKSVYSSIGTLLGFITAKALNKITYNGLVWTRDATSDRYVSEVGGKKYGLCLSGSEPNYSNSILIGSGVVADYAVRLRVNDAVFPRWVEGTTDISELIDFFIFNGYNVTKIKDSGAPIQYPTFIQKLPRADSYMQMECSTAAATARKNMVYTGGRFATLIDGDRLSVDFTYANSAANPTIYMYSISEGIDTLEYPVEGTITAGVNNFHFTTDGTDRWVKEPN